MSDNYPGWICHECGSDLGTPPDHDIWMHEGECGWCGKNTTVAAPRHYGYPEYKEQAK